MAMETHDTEPTAQLLTQTSYVLEIKLDDGVEIEADVGPDLDLARRQLASIHATTASEAFLLLGEHTIVRGRDIRYVRLREAGREAGPRTMGSRKPRMAGGDNMETYETERGGSQAVRPRGGGGEGRGFLDEQGFGYGRRPWSETKPFFITSEFLLLAGVLAGLAIAMGVLDDFNAPRGWLLITILAAAYMVSGGLAKSGTRDPNPRERGRDYG